MAENTEHTPAPGRKQGFAAWPAEKRREIARRGGKAAHANGTAHKFTPEEAQEAGRKGGYAVSRNRKHMAEIGREGGKQSHNGGSNSHDEDEQQHYRDGLGKPGYQSS